MTANPQENEETTEGIVAGVLEDIMNQVCTGKTKQKWLSI